MRKQTRIADVILLYLNNLTDDDGQIIISEVWRQRRRLV